jgi:hypothetical protein
VSRISDYERGYAAGHAACVLNEQCEKGKCQFIEDAALYALNRAVAGVNRGQIATEFFISQNVAVFTIKMEEVREQIGRVPRAGLLGSGLWFVQESDVPPESLDDWWREKVREHLAATPETLVIVIPVLILYVLIPISLPMEIGPLARECWEEIQALRATANLSQEPDGTVQQCNENKRPWAETAGDWSYHKGYIDITQLFAIEIALSGGWRSEQILSAILRGRELREYQGIISFPAVGDSYSNGMLTAGYDCGLSFAIEYESW